MQSVVFKGPNRCVVESKPDPTPGPDDVIVKVKASGICGTDIHMFDGDIPTDYPMTPGHEFSGIVAEVGDSVDTVNVGDRVAVDPTLTCGACYYCKRGKPHFCLNWEAIGVIHDGGFAELSSVPDKSVHALPDAVSFEEGAMLEPLSCCLHGTERAGIELGDTVLIIGGGAIGLMIAQLAKLAGARKTILSEPSTYRREAGAALGIDVVVDPVAESIGQAIKDSTFDGADVIFECTGLPEPTRESLDLAAKGGRIIWFGVANAESTVAISSYKVFDRELSIGGSFINPNTVSRALDILSAKAIQVAPLITTKLSLEEIERALELHRTKEGLKIMLKPASRT